MLAPVGHYPHCGAPANDLSDRAPLIAAASS